MCESANDKISGLNCRNYRYYIFYKTRSAIDIYYNAQYWSLPAAAKKNGCVVTSGRGMNAGKYAENDVAKVGDMADDGELCGGEFENVVSSRGDPKFIPLNRDETGR